jgi:hypothetical protein
MKTGVILLYLPTVKINQKKKNRGKKLLKAIAIITDPDPDA